MIPITLYTQVIPAEPPEYFVARCASKHIFLAPMSYQGEVCPVCKHNGRPYVPPDQYPCRHCGEFPKNHAVVHADWPRSGWFRACLFSPTQFEPLTQEELEARTR